MAFEVMPRDWVVGHYLPTIRKRYHTPKTHERSREFSTANESQLLDVCVCVRFSVPVWEHRAPAS